MPKLTRNEIDDILQLAMSMMGYICGYDYYRYFKLINEGSQGKILWEWLRSCTSIDFENN